MAQTRERTAVRPKKRFHHGDLREALIAATRELLIEHGPDGFTLADACRRAGVTTAAPYKNFRDKQEILEEIVMRGFAELAAANAKAVAEGGPGTIAGITAMGISYLDFAVAQPAVFRLMFGHKSEIRKVQQVDESGKQCLKHVIDEVAAYSRKHGHTADAEAIALRLWTFVHGASSLELDGDYERVACGLDVRKMIADVTPKLLGVTPDRRAPSRGRKPDPRARRSRLAQVDLWALAVMHSLEASQRRADLTASTWIGVRRRRLTSASSATPTSRVSVGC